MADNYLERREEESRSSRPHKVNPKYFHYQSLESLLLKNRSYRGYDSSYVVTQEELNTIVSVNTKIPSARNQQVLRFKIVTSSDAARICATIRLGGALPELHLPLPGTAPNAFIVICSCVEESKWVYVDVGISAQSMLLKAVEIGLNGICIGAFNKQEVTSILSLPYEPVLILAIGKGTENIQLTSITEEEDHKYYRKDGIQYVPKLSLKSLII